MSDPRESEDRPGNAPPGHDGPTDTDPGDETVPDHPPPSDDTGGTKAPGGQAAPTGQAAETNRSRDVPGTSWADWIAARAGWIFPLLILLFLLVSYLWPAKQSFQVEVITGGAEIGFDGGDLGTWRLPSATVCLPIRPSQTPTLPDGFRPTRHPECHTDHYLAFGIRNAVIRWPAGTTIRVRARADDGVSIDVTAVADNATIGIESSEATFGRSSRILIDGPDWRRHPSLPFSSGNVVLGLLPAAGEEGLVREGRYQIRETLPFRSRPITVDEGAFFAGDQIRFQGLEPEFIPPGLSATGTYFAYGFLAPGNDDDAGYSAVAYTALDFTRLEIGRIGAEDSRVDVNWTKRALRDPLLLALTALVGVFGLFFPVGGVLRFGKSRIRKYR
ncbi:hypothetical protein [Fodinicurvata sp. EGI_FJ10296]|uniref:hypothetical protein n=1 Tax=Fodinicurvata sp. EGI_FJ10296 TaxID=3231908 RepID=UPI0034547597